MKTTLPQNKTTHRIREVNSGDWQAFCQRVSEQRAGATVKIETIAADGTRSEKVPAAALETMTFDSSNPCNDVIVLRLGNAREIIYEIVEPIHIKLHLSEASGDFNPIQVEADSGVSLITMHPAIHAQMLEGLRIQ